MSLGSIVLLKEPLQDEWYRERYSHATCSLPSKEGGSSRRVVAPGQLRKRQARKAAQQQATRLEEEMEAFCAEEGVDAGPGSIRQLLERMSSGREVNEGEVQHVLKRAGGREHLLPDDLSLWYALQRPETAELPEVQQCIEAALRHFPPKLSRQHLEALMTALNEGSAPLQEEVEYVAAQCGCSRERLLVPQADAIRPIYAWYVSCALGSPLASGDPHSPHCCLDEDSTCTLL